MGPPTKGRTALLLAALLAGVGGAAVEEKNNETCGKQCEPFDPYCQCKCPFGPEDERNSNLDVVTSECDCECMKGLVLVQVPKNAQDDTREELGVTSQCATPELAASFIKLNDAK